MGLFDQVVGALAGSQAGGGNALLETVMQMLNDPQNGGLQGLIESFRQGGLGDIVDSWVSTGQNLPVSAEQITGLLGNSALGNLVSQLGLDRAEASASLASVLPSLIDSLTPNGQLPASGDLMAQGLDMLKGKFFA